LAKADGVELLDHHWLARQLHETRKQEQCGGQNAKTPENDGLAAGGGKHCGGHVLSSCGEWVRCRQPNWEAEIATIRRSEKTRAAEMMAGRADGGMEWKQVLGFGRRRGSDAAMRAARN
jgi:hypothetical protein